MKIAENVTALVGNTPLVRINNITKAEGIECEVCTYSRASAPSAHCARVL